MRASESAHITASQLLSVKGDKGENQNQHAYKVITLGYYSSLDCRWFGITASDVKYT